MAERRKRVYPVPKLTLGISFDKAQLDLLELAAKGAERSIAYVVRTACDYWLHSKDGRALLRRAREEQAPPTVTPPAEAQPVTPEHSGEAS